MLKDWFKTDFKDAVRNGIGFGYPKICLDFGEDYP